MTGTHIQFEGFGRRLDAYLALPSAPPNRHPAILLVHGIWGLDGHIRDVAERLSEEGYLTLAPDLYSGKGRTQWTPERISAALRAMEEVPPEVRADPEMLARHLAGRPGSWQAVAAPVVELQAPSQQRAFEEDLSAALQLLARRTDVVPGAIAAVGFSLGGGLSHLLTTHAGELRCAVVFYGPAPPRTRSPTPGIPVLGLYGGGDPGVTGTVPPWEEKVRGAGARFEVHVYPGAPHGFFDETRGSFRREAAQDAWERTLRFLAAELSPLPGDGGSATPRPPEPPR